MEGYELVANYSSWSFPRAGMAVVRRALLRHGTTGLTHHLCLAKATRNPEALSREHVSLLELLSPNNHLKLQLEEETTLCTY